MPPPPPPREPPPLGMALLRRWERSRKFGYAKDADSALVEPEKLAERPGQE